PRAARAFAVAPPKPDAPPVTTAAVSAIRMLVLSPEVSTAPGTARRTLLVPVYRMPEMKVNVRSPTVP
ncbi:hypothetical protein, partial [Saccharomonospora saliphila]|uniref:hypothetical protein n=1 Tax=Saccharomonospora saliphila TaxID=369829 RepID=UPI0022B3C67C